MITDQDVVKLKETFLTKEEAKSFATKEALSELAEDAKSFATKEALSELALKVDGIQEQLGDLKMEVGELHDKFDGLETKFDSMDVKFDAMLDLLTGSMQEHAVGAVIFARHDRQIGALAAATGITLPD
jgi:predicted NUDIX family NTP pyrophosphohydrolase